MMKRTSLLSHLNVVLIALVIWGAFSPEIRAEEAQPIVLIHTLERRMVQFQEEGLDLHRSVVNTDAQPSHFNPGPAYPKIARRKGWEGTVTLKVRISPDGQPMEIEIKESSGYEALDRSAYQAVEKWQFLPARHNTLAYTSEIEIPIEFILKEGEK